MASKGEGALRSPAASTKSMFSLIIECRGASDAVLRECIANLSRQEYREYEAILVGVTTQRIVDVMAELPRGVVLIPALELGHVLTSDGINICHGSFILILFASDIIFPKTLRRIKDHIDSSEKTSPDVVVYDYIDIKSDEVCYLPGWDTDLLAYRDYVSNAFSISIETLKRLLNKKTINTPYELLLAAADDFVSVLHIAETLVGLGTVNTKVQPFVTGFDPILRFSVIIPNKNGLSLLPKCTEFINTIPDRVELIIVDNRSDDPAVDGMYDQMTEHFGAKILKFDRSFNYSAMINLGVANATNELLLLLNNDVFISDVRSVVSALAYATRSDVGVVGSILRYPDGRIQHAGIVLSRPTRSNFDTAHVLRFSDVNEGSHMGALTAPRNWQSVTGAFQAVRKSVFEAVGGYDEVNLPIEFNDIDFCLRVRQSGLKVVCLPLRGVVHDESHTRSKIDAPKASRLSNDAYQVMKARWPDCYENDPFFNAQLRKMNAKENRKTASRFIAALLKQFQSMMQTASSPSASVEHYIARAKMCRRLGPGVCIVAPFHDTGHIGDVSRRIAAACDSSRIDVSFVNSGREVASKIAIAAELFRPFCDHVTALYVSDLQMLARCKHTLGEGRRRVLILIDRLGLTSDSNLSDIRQFDEIWVPSGSRLGELHEELGGALKVLPEPVEHFLSYSADRPLNQYTGDADLESEAVRNWIRFVIANYGDALAS